MSKDLKLEIFAANEKGMHYPSKFKKMFKKANYKEDHVIIKLEDRVIDKGIDIR